MRIDLDGHPADQGGSLATLYYSMVEGRRGVAAVNGRLRPSLALAFGTTVFRKPE